MRSVALALTFVAILAVSAVAPAQEVAATNTLSQADLEDMLGPIALYPDSLLANVLAASTYPDEITQANKLFKGGKSDPSSTKWEPSVQAVAKVPEVLTLLADNIDWTTAVGEAYQVQPKDVTTAIQSLRAKATANGALQSNDQQTIVQEDGTVAIEPAQPDVVYVPTYDPQVIYEPAPYPGYAWGAGGIGFGAGVIVGSALDGLDFDWRRGDVSWGHWDGYRGGDVNVDRDFNRNISTGDINVNNRPRPGNEGEQWRPNQDKLKLDNGLPRTDKINDFRGDRGKQAMQNFKKPAAMPAVSPSPSLGTPALKKPTVRPNVPAARPATPAVRPNVPAARPATPAARPSTPTAARKPVSTPSAFNSSGSSNASRNRGSASRGSAPSGGARSSGGGGRGGGGGGGRGGGGRR